MAHTKKWFLNRIGKRIYRNYHKCCPACDEIAKNGLIIHDKQHADYLHLIECDFKADGVILNYRDKK